MATTKVKYFKKDELGISDFDMDLLLIAILFAVFSVLITGLLFIIYLIN